MKSTAPAFRFLGEFEQQATDYTIAHYTNQLSTTVTSTSKATLLIGKVCEYAVERNKTKQMSLQYAEIESAFETQIEEERKQMQMILTGYEEQLAVQISTTQRQIQLELARYRKEIENLIVQNNFTMQKLKQTYNIKQQILKPLYKQKSDIKKFYDAVQQYKDFQQINELEQAYSEIVTRIAKLEEELIGG